MRKRSTYVSWGRNSAIIVGVVMLFFSGQVLAEDLAVAVAEDMTITAPRFMEPARQAHETVYTGTEMTREGLELQGGKARSSVYESIKNMAGVSVEGVDATGLAVEQKYIRIRGVRGYLGALTVAGIPNYGGNPMGPREYLYDTENLDGIAVYKGVIPVDLSTGVGARGGAVALRPLWPGQDAGLKASVGLGSDNYHRLFLRLDSGALPKTGTRSSASYTYAEVDKWKGKGKSGPRENLNLMVSQPLWSDSDLNVWYNRNDMKQHLYRSLSYDQAQDIENSYTFDYNTEQSGGSKEDIYYYDNNRGEYLNNDLLAEIPLLSCETFDLMLKPYYSAEDTDVYEGTSSKGGVILRRTRDIERYGFVAEAHAEYTWGTISCGYWNESVDMDIGTRIYDPVTFAFKGYGMATENEEPGTVHSPWLKLAGTVGKLNWQTGLKYFYYREPASRGYTSTMQELVEAPDLYRTEKEYDELLPTIGISLPLNDCLEMYSGYGRNQIRPYSYMPLINLYNQNRATFQAKGIALDDLFNGYDMEVSDNLELGLRYWDGWLELRSAAFFSKHKNLLTTVYDPRVDLSYAQNVGEATGAGVELEAAVTVNESVSLFANPSYTALTYDQDMVYQGNHMVTEGNQLVDTPEWMVKAGAVLSRGDFRITPTVRYVGRRYGDAEHTEPIPDHVLFDLRADYTFGNLVGAREIKVALDLTNLLDEKYVSAIKASDDSRNGRASYYAGAPFTAMLTLSVEL